MSESINYIPNRIKNAAVGGHVCGAEDVIDDSTGLTLEKVAGGALEEKEYTSGSDNGMGRVVLRKNLVGGVNTLTQAMMNKSNTIYVIQYDFTLGEDITVPEGCVLEFEGGSLNGNFLISQNTILIGDYSRSRSLCGAFLNQNGEYISNAIHIGPIKTTVKQSWSINRGIGNFWTYALGAFAIDSDYIYQLCSKDDDTTAQIVVMDRDTYQVYGKTSIPGTHGNSADIIDDKLYIQVDGKLVYQSVSIVLSNARSETATTFISTNISCGNFFSYDLYSERIYIHDNYHLIELDKNFNTIRVLNRTYDVVESYIQQLGSTEHVFNNESFVRGGICVIGASIHITSDNINKAPLDVFKPYIIMVDINTDKVLVMNSFDINFSGIEPEGIKYIDDNTFMTSNAIKHYESDEDENSYSWMIHSTNSYLNQIKTTNNLFVDNTFIGVSYGSPSNPFKTIEETILFIQSTHLFTEYNIHLVKSNTDYIYGSFTITGITLNFIGIDSDYTLFENNVYDETKISSIVLAGKFINCLVSFKNIGIKKSSFSDNLLYIIDCKASFSLSKISGNEIMLTNSTVSIDKSNINITGTLFSTTSLSSNNVYIKSSTVVANYLMNLANQTDTMTVTDCQLNLGRISSTDGNRRNPIIQNTNFFKTNTFIQSKFTFGGSTTIECVYERFTDANNITSILSLLDQADDYDSAQIVLYSLSTFNFGSQEAVLPGYYKYISGTLLPITPLSPSNKLPYKPAIGTTYYNTSYNKVITWNGSSWVNVDGSPLS